MSSIRHGICSPDEITVVYSHGGEQVRDLLAADDLDWCEQIQRLGTGHAVIQALPYLQRVDQVVILYGDVPLITGRTLQAANGLRRCDLVLLTEQLEDATGYGRILRDAGGRITEIVEQKDASDEQLLIKEINTGILAVKRSRLEDWLSRIGNRNAQREYYLTDIIALAVQDGVEIEAVNPASEEEVMGINDRRQLAYLERHVQRERAAGLMKSGVTLADPARLDVRW